MDYLDELKENQQSRIDNIEKAFDSTYIEKGKKAGIGEIRTHGGVKVQKQGDGSWKPVKRGNKSSSKEEEPQKKARLKFSNLKELQQAKRILYEKGYKTPESPNKGAGYYRVDDVWRTIDIDRELEKEVSSLLKEITHEVEYKKPLEYKVFHHGGYLD